MAAQRALLLSVAIIVLILVCAPGGETPVVFLITFAAGSITQLYWVLQTTLFSRAVQPYKPQSSVSNNSSKLSSSALALMARNVILRMFSYLPTGAKSPRFHQLGSKVRYMFAMLVFARLLQWSGLMTPIMASQAAPIAFVLGVAMKRTLPKDPSVAHDMRVVTFWSESASLAALKPHLTRAAENPYDFSFWSELLTPISNGEPIEKVSLHPSDILSDLYHSLILM